MFFPNQNPIGIFDSGVGGLTVFAEVKKLLPNESIFYLGDTARVPYGSKSAVVVRRYSLANVNMLMALEIDREIPPELYRTIAEVMAYVYRIDKKAKKSQPGPKL